MSDSRLTPQQKEQVVQRAKRCCEYCQNQEDFSPDSFSVEHITPKSDGGTFDLSNLALACQGCNNRKYTSTTGTDPLTGEIAPLYHPRQHKWSEHFAWNHDYTSLIGVTPTGRATVEKLQLNRQGVVNLRRALHGIGEHPPSGKDKLIFDRAKVNPKRWDREKSREIC